MMYFILGQTELQSALSAEPVLNWGELGGVALTLVAAYVLIFIVWPVFHQHRNGERT